MTPCTDGDVSEVQAKLLNFIFIEQCKKLLAVPANVVQLKEEAFLSVCDLVIVFGHCTADCGKAPGQATLAGAARPAPGPRHGGAAQHLYPGPRLH